MYDNIWKGQGGTVNQTDGFCPPKCSLELAFSKQDYFFVCELSKPVRQTAWKAKFQQVGIYSVYALLIKKSNPRQKVSVDDDHFVMPVQQNEKISYQDTK